MFKILIQVLVYMGKIQGWGVFLRYKVEFHIAGLGARSISILTVAQHQNICGMGVNLRCNIHKGFAAWLAASGRRGIYHKVKKPCIYAQCGELLLYEAIFAEAYELDAFFLEASEFPVNPWFRMHMLLDCLNLRWHVYTPIPTGYTSNAFSRHSRNAAEQLIICRSLCSIEAAGNLMSAHTLGVKAAQMENIADNYIEWQLGIVIQGAVEIENYSFNHCCLLLAKGF